MQEKRAWVPQPSAGSAVLVTASAELRDEVARIAAAAAVSLTVVTNWRDAGTCHGVLLVGADRVPARPFRGGDAILVGVAATGADLWHAAAGMGAERVAVLPEAASWLAEHLSRHSHAAQAGRILGIIGGVGGAGASTLSCWVAAAAAATGTATLLVDGDPWGGGLEVPLGAEGLPGVRWQDVGQVQGSLNPLQLAASLPVTGGFSLLGWRQKAPEPGDWPGAEATGAVLDAVRHGYALTVMDIGRWWAGGDSLLPFCDDVVVLVPATLRAALGARAVVEQLPGYAVRAVVRGPLATELDEALVADSVGCELAGYLPQLRGTRAAEHGGRILERGRNRQVRRLVRAVLSAPAPPTGAAA